MSFNSLYSFYKLRRSQWLKTIDLRKLQEKKLRFMIRHAYENVPFYHEKYREAKISPNDINTIEDLQKLPFVTKSEIHAVPKEFIARTCDISQCTERRTGGSTGIPISIYYDKNALAMDAALWMRAHWECGLRLGDKMALIIDPHLFVSEKRWYQKLGLMRKEYISILDSPDKQITELKCHKPEIIQGYPSSILLLALELRRKNETRVKPRLIFTEAELINEHTRELIRSAFGSELFDLFASREFGLLAWECPKHIGYHVNSENMVMEILQDEEGVGPNERGEIVGTTVANYAMPLIRYRTNDVGLYSDEACECRRGLPILKVLEGRSDDLLVDSRGRIVSPLIFFPYPFINVHGITQFKVFQEKVDKFTILLVVDEHFPKDIERVWEDATLEMRRIFGLHTSVDFKITSEIPREASGKLRKVVSKVKPNLED